MTDTPTTRYYMRTGTGPISEEEYLLSGLPRFVERLNNHSHMISLLLLGHLLESIVLFLLLTGVL